ncbi:DUF374 domain-containing protein [Candidatus Sumerlaeota bacterium]|nr:DUF374 domain-containing protein [Candidatus Sumerlaeota bacterium]
MNWRHVRFNLIEWTLLPIGILLLKAILATYRFDQATRTRVEQTIGDPRVFAVTLHGMSIGLLALSHIVREKGKRLVVMTSPSRDGRLMDKIVSRFGINYVKGSSRSKSIEGARGIIDAVRAGDIAMITPDGPRGPLFVPKKGFIRMVPASDAKLRVIAVGARHALTFGSWDRLFLPLPFSFLQFNFRDFHFDEPQTEDEETELLERMKKELIAVAREVDCPITRPYDADGNQVE